MRRLAILVLTAAGLAALAPAPADAQSNRCRVAYVVDGDTFNCRDGTTVRLLLINAPDGGAYGDAARRALLTLLPVDATVSLEGDSVPRDGAGRRLAYVFLQDGRMANEVMVRLGYAFYKPDPPNERYARRLRSAEATAREGHLGLWAHP